MTTPTRNPESHIPRRGPRGLLRRLATRLHRDQQGDEGVNKLLILAVIAVPLLLMLIEFGSSASSSGNKALEAVKQNAGSVSLAAQQGEVQELVQRRQEMFQMMSNVMQSQSDAAMNVIQNIK